MKKQNKEVKEDNVDLVEKPGEPKVELSSPIMEESEASSETPTSTKRDLILKVDSMGLYYIGYDGGGEQPKEFKGSLFTSKKYAQQALNNYLAKK